MADSGQRTEKPTEQRLRKARSEGQFPTSKEFVSAIQFLAFVTLTVSFGEFWFLQVQGVTRQLLKKAFTISLTPQVLIALVRGLMVPVLTPLLWGGAVLFLAVLLAQLGSTGFGISPSKLAPDIKRLDFFSRIKSLPGQNFPPFLQALALVPLIGLVVYHEVAGNLNSFLTLPWMSPQAGALRIAASLNTVLWRAGSLFLVVGLVDLVWQRRRYTKQLRMTKQEVREEAKEQQGNPQMKMRIRRIQRDLARRQMMKEIPTATAVIVNPTHYAVAIRYSLHSGSAPKVVAKGKNYLALRIRKLALEHQVPIVENPPLAQALYKSAKVGQEIPADLYRAVAEILAYIYRLMGGRLPGA
jgi:flagellar biosynthesis protein FlhB